ncbi:long-chain-fatty-acid--CoA ligase [Sphingorhabdus sp. Alg239-R122]|uniref:long-chain-fatty-acid--CoA ligase n=1 Tax=Sphingorhabdus sp. Alg239-R122 TaxID=2305989 RepID=UPI0013D8F1B1|nr:long-chain-fatty-acid--CoA ligase [Sphingorhabdus sp. Alg239-R122]
MPNIKRDSLHSCVDYWVEERGSHMALSDAQREVDYKELAETTSSWAAALTGAGFARGTRMAWLGKNSITYAMLFVAASRAGMVVVPVGWRLSVPEVSYILNDTGAHILICEPDFTDMASQAKENCKELRTILCDGEGSPFPDLTEWLAGQPQGDVTEANPNDCVLQLYTSGTTGSPKGALLSNYNLFSLREPLEEKGWGWAKIDTSDQMAVIMPIAHIAGSGYFAHGFYAGVGARVLPEFTPDAALDAVEAGVTQMFLVPTAVQMMITHPRATGTDFSRLKYMHYGAAPMPLELLRQAMDVMGCGFCQHYGMTETTGTFSMLQAEDHDPMGNARMRSAGQPLPGVEVKIVDENGETLTHGQVGEIATRSPLNMIEYWNKPDKTAETVDSEGWLITGDAAYMDEDGYIFIQDRVKDMIITGGENVYPAEVENAIFGHEDVLEVAVIGVPDEKWGECVKAVVVPRPDRSIDEGAIIAHARSHIAAFKAPKSVDVIAEMPRNASGKILRRELRAPYWEGRERGVN